MTYADVVAAGCGVSRSYALARSLRLPHDIIKADNRGERTALVYPIVATLIRSDDPETSAERSRRVWPD